MKSIKVFRAYHTEEIEYISPINEGDFETARFDGSPRSNTWVPISVVRITEEPGRIYLPGDLPSSSLGDLVINCKAKEKLGSFFEMYGELLPLSCNSGEYWALNITCIIDALDESRSNVLRSDIPGRLLMIHKYSFRPDALVQAVIFRIPQLKRSWFATDVFVELIKSSGLTGLTFKQIWAPD